MSGVDIPAAGYVSDTARDEAEMEQVFEDFCSIFRGLPGGGSQTTVGQIASHSFTPVRDDGCIHSIDTQGLVASDTLTNIAATNVRDGQVVGVRITNNGRTIQVVDSAGGAGQIKTMYGDSPTLNSTKLIMFFAYNAAITAWEEINPITTAGRGTLGDNVVFNTALTAGALALKNQAAALLFGNPTNASAAPQFFSAGTANQVVGVGTGGNTIEGKTISGTNIVVTPSAGTIALSLPLFGATCQPYRKTSVVQAMLANGLVSYGFGQSVTNAGTGTPTPNFQGGVLFQKYTTAASLNAVGGFNMGGAYVECRYQSGPILYFRIRTDASIASLRLWIGVFSGAPTASDSPAVHMAAFRFSTSAGDANFKCVTGAGGAPTVADSGVAVAINTSYDLAIDMSDPAQIKFFINGTLVQTLNTTLPTATQNLGPGVLITSLSVAGQAINIARLYMEQV